MTGLEAKSKLVIGTSPRMSVTNSGKDLRLDSEDQGSSEDRSGGH